MPAGTYVHDRRHRYSYELRPSEEFDGRLRAIAADLEGHGLLEPGATTAPRFHPHLTLLRADTPSLEAAVTSAEAMRDIDEGAPASFDEVAAFGDGRIPYLLPTSAIRYLSARAALVEALGEECVDPLVHTRDWVPHVTIAYAVPQSSRAAAHRHIAAHMPISGAWASVDVWDLDVRPTVRVHHVEF